MASKRKSGVVDEVGPKKGRTDQFASVANALLQSPASKEVAELMIAVLPSAFAGDHGNRHKFQDQILDVVRKEMAAGEEKLTVSLNDIKGKIAGAETERERRNLAVIEAQQNVEQKSAQLSSARATEVAAKEQVVAAKEKRNVAEAEKTAVAASTAEALASKQVVEESLSELGKLLNSDSPTDPPPRAAERTAAVRKSLEPYLRDPAMLDAVGMALAKAPASRGSFDKLVLEQLDQEAKKVLAEAEGKLAEAQPKAESAAAALLIAESTYGELVDRQQNAEIDASNAEAAKIEGETMLREAQQAVASLHDEIEAALKNVQVADDVLQDFQKSIEDFENFRCPKVEEIVQNVNEIPMDVNPTIEAVAKQV